MENQVIRAGLKNTIYVVSAQSVSLLLGIARTLILPILLGVTNFGYWQVYLLYMSYVGVLALGFNDGIYLRYGKFDYADLPKKTFRSSIKLFVFIQLIIMILVSCLIWLEPDLNKQIAMLWASLNIPIAGITGVLIYVLQVTNQLKKYSFYTILDKIVVLIIIAFIFLFKSNNYIIIIAADTFSKLLVLGLMGYSCKDLIWGKGCGISLALKETIENIKVGIKLMLANFTGMLVLGYGRFILERTASVEIYGTYSFAISTINIVLVFITAIGLVIYPTLNRIEENKYPKYFVRLNQILLVIILGLLILFFPLKIFVSLLMPDYIGVFEYLPIIFAIVFIQTKMQIVINPFYKLLREEKAMLNANVIGLIMAVALITPFYLLTKSVLMVAAGTLLAMAIRLYWSELYLKKQQNLVGSKNILIEILGIIVFIICGFQSNSILGLVFYLLIYLSFLASQTKNIKLFMQYLRG